MVDARPPNWVIDFDQNGPRVGSCRLLARTDNGFQTRALSELAGALGSEASCIVEFPGLEQRLTRIALAMNTGDVALAAIATAHLSADALRRKERADLFKASPDDPRHPGYPAGEPDGKGGQFRPKNELPAPGVTFAAPSVTGGKAGRLAQRRAVRSTLRRVLSAKRLLRILGENAAAALTEEIPGLDVLMTGVAIEDDLALLKELKDAVTGTDAALDLAEAGAVDLESLRVSGDDLSFDSYEAFRKIEVEKQFGSAGENIDYHHIVEQGPNAGSIPQTDLQSTGNIIRLPKLLHEEVSSWYSTPQMTEEGLQTPRQYLRGKSFEFQRNYGLDALRTMGIIK